jgi:hypothetical protein
MTRFSDETTTKDNGRSGSLEMILASGGPTDRLEEVGEQGTSEVTCLMG